MRFVAVPTDSVPVPVVVVKKFIPLPPVDKMLPPPLVSRVCEVSPALTDTPSVVAFEIVTPFSVTVEEAVAGATP